MQPTFAGYSIGHWVDEAGSGRYDTLEVETRYFRGPRAYDATGLPLARDNQSIIKERFHLDAANANTLYDDITVYDHALTRPWTITRKTVRDPIRARPGAPRSARRITAGSGSARTPIYLSADGMLMPSKKDQAPPDLRYFKRQGAGDNSPGQATR